MPSLGGGPNIPEPAVDPIAPAATAAPLPSSEPAPTAMPNPSPMMSAEPGGQGGMPAVGGAGGEPGQPPVEEPPEPEDPRGHGGPLFGDLGEAERFESYYFQESDGQVVIEAEHFATQRYGNDDYRGARWWMVNSVDVNVKEDVPEFEARCDMAIEELENLATMPNGSDLTIRDIITNHNDSLSAGWEDVFAMFGCDPDTTDASTASGNAYIELLPDALYNDNNEVPHAACNWYRPEQGPKAYYRINFSTAGDYTITFRGLNRDVDSGDMHLGVGRTPGEAEQYQVRIGPPRTRDWEWVEGNSFSVEAGEYFVLIAGREDGFEVDKIVVSRGACRGCNGAGPDESPTVNVAQ